MDFTSLLSGIAEYGLAAITFIIIFSLLIILHECGHFWAARAAKVKVLEFGFGLPPKVWAKKTSKDVEYEDKDGKKYTEKTDMEWTLNAIPFGGFVRMLGEDEKSTDPGAFGQRPLLWRMLVVAGGVIMNFFLGWAIFTIALVMGMNPMMPTTEQKEMYTEQGIFEKKNNVVFTQVKGSVFEDLGLKEYDELVSLDGRSMTSPSVFQIIYARAVQEEKKNIDLVVQRFVLKDRAFVHHTIRIPVIKNSPFATQSTQVIIVDLVAGSPAEFARIQKGDTVISLEGIPIYERSQLVESITRQWKQGKKQLRLGIQREGESHVFIVGLGNNGKMGIHLENEVIEKAKDKIVLSKELLYYPVQPVQYSLFEAPKVAFTESVLWMGRTWDMIKGLVKQVTTDLSLPKEAGGPIAIADTTHTLTQFGDFSKILQFAAILSLSLAVVNMMPFPGLDGGRFIFLLAEVFLTIFAVLLGFVGIKKFPRKVPDSWEIPFHMLGYGLLLLLIIWISFNDVVRIFFSE